VQVELQEEPFLVMLMVVLVEVEDILVLHLFRQEEQEQLYKEEMVETELQDRLTVGEAAEELQATHPVSMAQMDYNQL
tara:strand:+ start:142 stop:375 length:234 start_codon:yes stop_codon:yes gene_type:complete